MRPHLLAMVQGDTSTTMLPAARRAGRDLREARRAALHRRHRVPGRQPVRDGRLGPRRRHGRAAEVPVRPVGQRADQPVGQGGRGDPGAPPHRGRDPRGVRRGHRRARALQLLRPRHDPRLLGSAAAQPPHRGDEHAVRRARVRPDHPRGGPAGRHRPARAGRPRDARGGPGPGAGGVRGRGAQDEQRGRGRDPGRRGRRRGARRDAAGLRHRDRHVVRPAARSRLADRHDGRQRAPRHRADDARRAGAGAAARGCAGARTGGGVDAAYAESSDARRPRRRPAHHGALRRARRVHLDDRRHRARLPLPRARPREPAWPPAGCARSGCDTWQDAAGNQCGHLAGRDPEAPSLLLGSHLDTVRDAGRYDGILGVLMAIEVVRALRPRSRHLPVRARRRRVLGRGGRPVRHRAARVAPRWPAAGTRRGGT